MIDEAIIVCTRNRPDDVETVLESFAKQDGMHHRVVVIVDGSDESQASRNEAIVRAVEGISVNYLRYPESPSATRQRNYGVDSLSDDIEIVHFFDDDVTLAPGCLDLLTDAFLDPDLIGAGGKVEVPGKPARTSTLPRRLFLLDAAKPGLTLASGACTSGQARAAGPPFEVRWLGGCSAYRRAPFLAERFDASLDGYALDGDLDLSYRVGRHGKLMVIPDAVVYHHESDSERASPGGYVQEHLVHRYWFLEKNIRHALRKPAFWWSTVGRILGTALSSEKSSSDELKGLFAAVRIIWNRSDPLLSRSPKES